MKILFVGEFAGFAGGIERFLFRNAELLRTRGHEIYGLFEHESRGKEQFRTVFDELLPWAEPARWPAGIDAAVVHKIRSPERLAEIAAGRPVAAVIHDHEYYCPRRSLYYPVTRGNCHRAFSRAFCGFCGLTVSGGKSIAKRARNSFVTAPALWRGICSTDRQVVISGFMRDLALRNGAAPEKVRLIPPGIVLQPEKTGGENTPPRILAAGQLIRGKGIDQLLKTMELVKGAFQLDILGSGEDEPMLRELAAPFGERVRFLRWSNSPEQLFAAADLVVLPWRWQEPFGLVGPEALAHGVPIAGFDVGGIREYLIDGQTGLLAPEGNLAALASAIDTLLDSPKLRQTLGTAGRNLVAEKFSEETHLNNWENLLLELKRPGN